MNIFIMNNHILKVMHSVCEYYLNYVHGIYYVAKLQQTRSKSYSWVKREL